MKPFTRPALGILASLLLTAGFAQAAVHLDPFAPTLHPTVERTIGEDDPPPPPPPPPDDGGGTGGGGGSEGGGEN